MISAIRRSYQRQAARVCEIGIPEHHTRPELKAQHRDHPATLFRCCFSSWLPGCCLAAAWDSSRGPAPGSPSVLPGHRQLRLRRGPGDTLDYLYPLAAAFFAGFVFTTLVPDALLHSWGTLAAFAGGAGGMALLSRHVLKRDPCCEGGHDHKGVHKGLGALSLVAMAMCSVNDGLLIGLAQPAWHSGLNLGMFLTRSRPPSPSPRC